MGGGKCGSILDSVDKLNNFVLNKHIGAKILRDMGFKISNPDKRYIKSSLSKTEVERRFWELYDKYSEEE